MHARKMPREKVPNFPPPTPSGRVQFCHSIQPGAQVVTVQLTRPLYPVANAVWFVHFDAPPANDGRDPYADAGKTVLQGDAGAAFRRYIFPRKVRALIFLPNRGTNSVHGLVQASGRTTVPKTWRVWVLASGPMRREIFVRHHEGFRPARWATFDTMCAWDSVMARDVQAFPGLDAVACTKRDGAWARVTVRFGPMTLDRRVLLARSSAFGENILTCVNGQGGTVLPELDADSRAAWTDALHALRQNTLVVGPVWLLVLVSQYITSMTDPDAAARVVDAKVRGHIVPRDAPLAPDELLPPLKYVYWTDVPEANEVR